MGRKMYYILKIIQSCQKRGIATKDIVAKLETYSIYMDIKSVYANIKRINEFFYEWLHQDMIISVKRVGFVINQEIFSDGELQFLRDSIIFHQDLKNEDKQKLINKLMHFSSCIQQQRLIVNDSYERDLSFSLFLNLSTIMKAIENKNVISFQYINYEVMNHHLIEVPSQNGNDKDQYLVSPYQIVSHNNHYYLIGYNDKHKNQLTTYRIDRMRLIHSDQRHFIEIREQFDMHDEIEKMTNMFISHRRDTLQIECHQKLLREVASRFGTDIKVQKLYQENYLVTIEDIDISDGLIGWLMMLQDQIKVVSPSYLVEEMKHRLLKMIQKYEIVL